MSGLIAFDKNYAWVDSVANSGYVPRVVMAIGPSGCGKTELAKIFASRFSLQFVSVGKTTDDVRKIVQLVPMTGIPTLYVIHLKDMHTSAANSLLKILEETPQQSYFWLEVERKEQTLATIVSRSVPYVMPMYRNSDLSEIAQGYSEDPDEWSIVPYLATTPGKVIATMLSGKAKEVYSFVDKIVDNCIEVSTGNALKISDSIKFKDEEEGYDLDTVLYAIQSVALRKWVSLCQNMGLGASPSSDKALAKKQALRYFVIVSVISEVRSSVEKKGINKKAVFDEGILTIRRRVNDSRRVD